MRSTAAVNRRSESGYATMNKNKVHAILMWIYPQNLNVNSSHTKTFFIKASALWIRRVNSLAEEAELWRRTGKKITEMSWPFQIQTQGTRSTRHIFPLTGKNRNQDHISERQQTLILYTDTTWVYERKIWAKSQVHRCTSNKLWIKVFI